MALFVSNKKTGLIGQWIYKFTLDIYREKKKNTFAILHPMKFKRTLVNNKLELN